MKKVYFVLALVFISCITFSPVLSKTPSVSPTPKTETINEIITTNANESVDSFFENTKVDLKNHYKNTINSYILDIIEKSKQAYNSFINGAKNYFVLITERFREVESLEKTSEEK